MHLDDSPSFTSLFFFFQAEDGIRDSSVTGVQTCALPIFDWYLPGKYQSIDVTKGDPLPGFTPQHVELVPKDKDFGLQCGPRPEQSDHSAPDQPAEIAHRGDYQPIRRLLSAALSLR